jgi:hypothetical protein
MKPSVTVMQMVSVTISVTILRAWSARWAGEAATKAAPKAARMVEERILNGLRWVCCRFGLVFVIAGWTFEKVRQEVLRVQQSIDEGKKDRGRYRIGSTAVTYDSVEELRVGE